MNARRSEKRSHDRAPENRTISVSLSEQEKEIITKAARADGRNRSEFLRHYGKILAQQILDEAAIGSARPRRPRLE